MRLHRSVEQLQNLLLVMEEAGVEVVGEVVLEETWTELQAGPGETGRPWREMLRLWQALMGCWEGERE